MLYCILLVLCFLFVVDRGVVLFNEIFEIFLVKILVVFFCWFCLFFLVFLFCLGDGFFDFELVVLWLVIGVNN